MFLASDIIGWDDPLQICFVNATFLQPHEIFE
jgi:hypothetical protein